MHGLSEIKHAVNSQSFYNQPVLEIPVEGRVRNYDFFSQKYQNIKKNPKVVRYLYIMSDIVDIFPYFVP